MTGWNAMDIPYGPELSLEMQPLPKHCLIPEAA